MIKTLTLHNKYIHLIFGSETRGSLHSFITTAPQQADLAGNILLFFYKKKRKQNKKIIKYYQSRQLVVGLL
jgi:hypothetical protein